MSEDEDAVLRKTYPIRKGPMEENMSESEGGEAGKNMKKEGVDKTGQR